MSGGAGRPRRLLTIGHSYSVGVNRRLAHELAAAGEWDVTAAAPARFHGDFGWHVTTAEPGEQCTLARLPAYFTQPVHLMLYGRPLFELLRRPWDLVHCWEEPYVAAAAEVAFATSARVPLVFATFQNIAKRYPPPFNWIERRTFKRADGFIAFGRTVFDVLTDRGVPPSRVRTIPPGVDTIRFAPDPETRAAVRASLGWRDEVPVVGFLGRLVPEKGVTLLAETLDRVALPWRALIIGAGPLEATLRAWARRHGARVAINTEVRHQDVPRWLNAMDVLAAPSQSTPKWREQFGRMLIEAFACGVPVVASDSGEIPHVVGGSGIIVAEGDVAAWTRALQQVLGDEALRRDLSARGRLAAVSRYDWPVVARQHADFFRRLVDGALA
ncbi:MAG: glycosyl transferase family 1 [Acidobacteria bacterium RIFCSPLOWO2_02_FULL_65_29]|nr:MAG: glycosyl transferase family 1 [Acidobacteria bacterium RIFCSPLOWO2_02_FULL_65_29]